MKVVIDTSIARAAGKTIHPISSCCRKLLDELVNNDYIMVLTPEISKEWREHQSNYARRWRGRVYDRRLFIELQNVENTFIREKLTECNLTQKQTEAIEKDMLLIEAALATDKIIFSLDDTSKNICILIINEIKVLKSLFWINPQNDIDQLISILSIKRGMHEKYKLENLNPPTSQ